MSTITNTRKEYENEISNTFKSVLSRIWWMVGIKKGYLASYNRIRNEYIKKLKKNPCL